MSHIDDMAEARDAFSALEGALRRLSPWVGVNLTKGQQAKFRKARRAITASHAELAEIAEDLNGGAGGEIVPLGGGS